MLEMGDTLKEIGSHGRWWGVVVVSEIEDVKVAQYEKDAFVSYIDTISYRHEEIRSLIRNGHIARIGNVRNASLASVFHDSSYSIDIDTMKGLYEDDGLSGWSSLPRNSVFWDTVQEEVVEVEVVGSRDDTLSDELLRFTDGSVESITTVEQAMRKGIWVLLTPDSTEQ
jgi:hypothetical protein